jgi:hypothetical protein
MGLRPHLRPARMIKDRQRARKRARVYDKLSAVAVVFTCVFAIWVAMLP